MRLTVSILVLLLAGCLSNSTDSAVTQPSEAPVVPHDQAIEFSTASGNITILLYPEAAPQTVALMLQYVDEGYYNNRGFGRIVPGHVIQITDLTPNGATEDARRVPLETNASYHFSAGAVGTARDVAPDSGGPEFFIMDFATSHLNGNFTVWGQVIAGMDVVRAIARGPGLDAPALPDPVADQVPFLFDRIATPPVTITSSRLLTPVIADNELPDYPLQVAKNIRVGDMRHSLQWPHGVGAGHESDFTWFARPYNNDPVPDADGLQVHIGGETVMVQGDETAGVYHFGWAPPAAGAFNATLMQSGTALATLVVRIP